MIESASMAKICNFQSPGNSTPHLGVLDSNLEEIVDLTALDSKLSSFFTLEQSATRAETSIRDLVNSCVEIAGELTTIPLSKAKLQIPFSPPEVWAAGVTYFKSREAREVETSLKGLYNYVYDAKRPEIFFKTTGSRCVGPDQEVGIRNDSKWSVPEPELTVVLGNERILGYTIGNDMSARDIEGENPLYLPQAKVFRNCCALGPVVTLADDIQKPQDLMITLKILRNDDTAFQGSISTSKMKRSIEELVSYLKSNNSVPSCSVLMTGTGIVPPDDFSLRDGDEIEIEIERIGKLRNTARVLS
jgi:2-dehydro-3-deoxy-D-arabinonate dehydratase